MAKLKDTDIIGQLNTTDDITMEGDGALRVAAGTTAQRPTPPIEGMLRENTDTKRMERFNGLVWSDIYEGADLIDLEDRIEQNENDIVIIKDDIVVLDGRVTENEFDIAENATSIQEINEIFESTQDPTGFENQIDSTVALNIGLHEMSISPVAASYDVWSDGEKFVKTGIETVAWTNVDGMHYFYFDAFGVLQHAEYLADSYIIEGPGIFISYIYWDVANQSVVMFGDERHGHRWSGAIHQYHHEVDGLRIVSGLALTDIQADGTGDAIEHIQFGSQSGEIYDEDIAKDVDVIGPTVGLPLIYLDGADPSPIWKRAVTAVGTSVAVDAGGTGRLLYNSYIGGVWSTSVVDNLAFALLHVFTTTAYDGTERMFCTMGQAEYNTTGAAREGATVEILNLAQGTLKFPEFHAVASIIIQTADVYSNVAQSRIRTTGAGDDYIDWRGTNIGSGNGTSAPSNSASDIVTDTSDFVKNLSALDVSVQLALDTLDKLSAGGGLSVGDLVWQHTDSLVGERVWADGSLLLLAEYPDLFGKYGITWGGDGLTTFGVPLMGGKVYEETTTGEIKVDTNGRYAIQAVPSPPSDFNTTVVDVQIGDTRWWPGNIIPQWDLECAGQSLLASEYPTLFSIIGYEFGGSGLNFNLPNLQGVFPGSIGTQDIGGTVYGVLGGVVGSEVSDSIQSHVHDISHNHTASFVGNSHNHIQDSHDHTSASHFHTMPTHRHNDGHSTAHSANSIYGNRTLSTKGSVASNNATSTLYPYTSTDDPGDTHSTTPANVGGTTATNQATTSTGTVTNTALSDNSGSFGGTQTRPASVLGKWIIRVNNPTAYVFPALEFGDITTDYIADDAVTNVKMADNAVDTLEIVDGAVTFSKLAAEVMNAIFPVGDTYFQLPGKGTPADLGRPGTWTNISSEFAGNFFRVEGGNASAFESGQQTDDNKSHNHVQDSHGHTASFAGSALPTHNHTVGILIGGSNAGGTYAYRSTTSYGTQTRTTSSKSAGTPAGTVTVNGSTATNQTSGGTEARPVNETIRVWERTA